MWYSGYSFKRRRQPSSWGTLAGGRRRRSWWRRKTGAGRVYGWLSRKKAPARRNVRWYTRNKKLSRARARLALPPLKLKYHDNLLAATQYVTYANDEWSYIDALDDVAVGATETTRESNVVKFLPFTIKVKFYQAASKEHSYRVLLLRTKDINLDYSDIEPQNVLNDSATSHEALLSSYMKSVDRTYRFRIVKDFLFEWNSYVPNADTKWKKIKIPTHTVHYDPDTAAGTLGIGKFFLLIVSDNTGADPDYTVRMQWSAKFIDQ